MSQPSKRHLDRFTSFCRAHPCAQHTNIQTTLRSTSVAIGRICALHAGDGYPSVVKSVNCADT